MSQLVIESNMPTSCLNCPCRGFDGFGQKAYCTLSPIVEGTTEGRPQTCPIIAELPPHGDLIDISEVVAVAKGLKDSGKYSRSWEEYMYMALAIVDPVLGSNR